MNRKTPATLPYICILLLLVSYLNASESTFDAINWKVFTQLPSLSNSENQIGVAGAFSGVIGNQMVVAGGANFPDTLPFYGGKRRYHDDIYIYDFVDSKWNISDKKLKRRIAYGVSINLPEGILCIGGNDGNDSFADVFLISIKKGVLSIESWEPLPVPLSYMSGGIIDNKIYIAGGVEKIESGATNHFLVFDIKNRKRGWNVLPTWPGPPRAFNVAATQRDGNDNCFYLFSGRNFVNEKKVDVLNDGYKYNPRLNSWKRLDEKSVLFPVMAGLAVSSGVNHILFFGGSDGKLKLEEISIKNKIDSLRSIQNDNVTNDKLISLENYLLTMLNNHPGFSKDVLVYNTITNTIYKHSESSYTIPVVTNLFKYKDKIYITSGEIRPGVRTPDIFEVTILKSVKAFGFLNTTVVVVYFLILVLMGYFFSKRQKNSNDYFKGGGRVPWWVVGLSVFGTGLSAITFMAIPAKAYATDWSYMLFNLGIVLVAPIIVYLFIPFFRRLNITTAYEYLELRFNLTIRLISSIVFIIFQIGRMGIVLFLPSIALNVITGMDIFLCIGLMGVLSLLYTTMGGIEAVIWTDAFQVIVLLGGAIFSVYIISSDVSGGFFSIISKAAEDGKFHLADTSFNLSNPTMWTVLIASFFANITTYGTDQTMVQRYVSTRDEKASRRSVWTNAILVLPATLIFFFIGSALYVYYKEFPANLSFIMNDGDAIFPSFIFNQMPAGLTGLLIAGIFAAAMSTLSSSMNSAATAWSVDIHFRFGWSKNVDQLKIARIVTLVVGVLGISFAVMMATMDVMSLWDEFQKILGIVMGGLGGLFSLGMLTRKANAAGAIAGLVGSSLIQIWLSNTNHVHLLFLAATGFISCFVIGYVTSLFFSAKYSKNIDNLTIYRLLNKKSK